MGTLNHNSEGIEIWGGVECTIVRIKNQVHDQLEINGHEKRPGDLEILAELGIKKLRYPILWEKYVNGGEEFFALHDERFRKLSELGITPVAGLLHHGSGPFTTDLSDPGFPEKLSSYASAVAARFPWLKYYTPVNEPLTTARFSGLYGIWYPHARDNHAFSVMFLNQMKGIVLSMQMIRKINPEAVLVQTEDLCKVHSTKPLKYQADFENERRWLTYDILTGRVDENHPMWRFFTDSGVSPDELSWFLINKETNIICGFNYYITSERFLDHRYSRYPHKKQGGNAFTKYADVECVRVEEKPAGSYELLKEAWDRYHLPMAMSEVHLGCTREEQLRWFYEAWKTGNRLKAEGIDFRAVTAWSVLGSFGWDSLLRKNMNHYESGVFDLISGKPRPTALAKLIRDLSENKITDDPLLSVPGWWSRDIRITYHQSKKQNNPNNLNMNETNIYKDVRPLLIIGTNGSLGRAFERVCLVRGIVYISTSRSEMDITSSDNIENYLNRIKPWAVINAAGFSDIDASEKEPIRCFRENTLGAIILARNCAREGIPLVTFSTDQVFNGKKRNPYLEKDITGPLNTYGLSKRMAEERIITLNPETLIIRTSSFFNPWNENDMLFRLINDAMNDRIQKPVHFVSDIITSPAYVPDIVNITLDLLIDREKGIWHLSSIEGLSDFEFIKLAFGIAGVNDKRILPIGRDQMRYPAERPGYSVLMSSQGLVLPPIERLLHHYMGEMNTLIEARAAV